MTTQEMQEKLRLGRQDRLTVLVGLFEDMLDQRDELDDAVLEEFVGVFGQLAESCQWTLDARDPIDDDDEETA